MIFRVFLCWCLVVNQCLAASIFWNAGSSDWGIATNWSSNTVPTASDNVSIERAFTVSVNVNATVGDLRVERATLTHAANNDDPITYNLVITAAGNVEITASGKINVSGSGYAATKGLGGGTNSNKDGAGHGGMGGDEAGDKTTSDITYGVMNEPVSHGSGGGTGAGGGRIQISAGGYLLLKGNMYANGDDGANVAGAGGSVYLSADSISGSGNIRAHGGRSSARGGGGGGRIAVILTGPNSNFNNYTGQMTTYGGTGGASEGGAAGTVYYRGGIDMSGNGILTISNNGLSTYDWTLTSIPSGNIWNAGNVNITGGARFAPHDLYCRNLSMDAGCLISHENNTTTENFRIMISASGNVSFASTSRVNVSDQGYSAGSGPGGTAVVGGGAAHGGRGGLNGGLTSAAKTYGSITAPVNIGSGGEIGKGAGAIKIFAGGNLYLNTVSLDASAAAAGVGGAGAGGSVYVSAGALSGSGSIVALGGNSTGEGAGGGGRISVILTGQGSNFGTYTGQIAAYGGISTGVAESGATGTVYLATAAQGASGGNLIIKNVNAPNAAFATITAMNCYEPGSATYVGNVEIGGRCHFQICAGNNLITTNSGTTVKVLESSSNLVNAGTFVIGGNGVSTVRADSFSSNAIGSNVMYTGQSDDATVSIYQTRYYNLMVSNPGTTFAPADAMTVIKDLTVFAGNLLLPDTGASGNLLVQGNLIVAGLLVQQSGNLQFSSLQVNPEATWQNKSTGWVIVGGNIAGAGNVANFGNIILDSSGNGPGDADDIKIRSATASTNQMWWGSGNFTAYDVDVQNQGGCSVPQAGGPAVINVYSGRHSGNCESNWRFIQQRPSASLPYPYIY